MMDINILNLAGLFLNAVGTVAILFCPPPVPAREIMPNGVEKIPNSHVQVFSPPKSLRRKYYIRQYGFRLGVGLLLVGFVLQIIAELLP